MTRPGVRLSDQNSPRAAGHYPGGGVEISGSVKAYFALKLTGHDPSAEYMQRARRAILAHGGADAVNSFTRFYLALLGQIPYSQCPAVPPEFVLLPKWFPVNLYAVSSWSRTMIVPLSIISSFQPVRKLDPRLGIREVFLEAGELACAIAARAEAKSGPLSWDRFFRTVDRMLKLAQRYRFSCRLPPGAGGCGEMDAPAVPTQRRHGRHLSADRLEHHRAALLGYSDDSPDQYNYEQLKGSSSTTRSPARSAFSRASRPCGTRRLP